MLPHEIAAVIANNPALQAGYQNMLNWIQAGGKHGSLGGLVPNEAVVRTADMPWGENIAYDAAGNVISMYRPARPGEISPYGPVGGGPSAPEWTPAQLAAMPVPDAFKAQNIPGYVAPTYRPTAGAPAAQGSVNSIGIPRMIDPSNPALDVYQVVQRQLGIAAPQPATGPTLDPLRNKRRRRPVSPLASQYTAV